VKKIFAALFVASSIACASAPSTPPATTPPVANLTPNNPCDAQTNPQHHGEKGPNGKPFVCIDWQTFADFSYQPDPATVTANKNVHVEFWFFNMDPNNPPDMEVQLPGNLPVKKVKCKEDMCEVDVKSNATHAAGKYSIIDRNSGKFKDPDIIIEP
jgi:hypothetical protein